MKILVVVWNFYPNTAYTNHTKATVKGFKESGANCDVISIKPLAKTDNMAINKFFTGTKSIALTALGMLFDIIQLAKVSGNYDVIYCSCGDNRIIRLTQWLARLYKKIIVHERTEYPDVFYPHNKKGDKKLELNCKLVNRFDKIFVISTFIKKFYVSRGVDENKLQVYPMIVDPSRFCGLKRTQGKKYIAYCGNLQDSKDGVSDLIKAYGQSKIAKEMYELWLIGNMPKDNEWEKYNSLISQYGIEKKVCFTGQVSREDMPQKLTDADLLVLCRPANHQAEGGFPTKLGEYLATGNPVLVTRVGDIGLYIKDGVNGFLSEPDDINLFSKKLDDIASHYDKARNVGEKGKELVFSSFNYKVQSAKVLETLKSLFK
jgi:glycosyltransferase involved in cell wall biosynthesis